MKLHCFLETKKQETVLRLTFNTTDIQAGRGELLYFMREPGHLNPKTVGRMVKVGRTKLQPGTQIIKVMSDMQILVKRRGVSVRSARRGHLPRVGTAVEGGRQPRGSLMPCYKQTQHADTIPLHQRNPDAVGSNCQPIEIHPLVEPAQVRHVRPLSGRPLSARLERPISGRSMSSGRPNSGRQNSGRPSSSRVVCTRALS